MTPFKFKECNTLFARDQEEYIPVPALKFSDGEIIMCWKLTLSERLALLLTGKLWHRVLTFNDSLQPQLLEASKPELIQEYLELESSRNTSS